MKRLTALLAAAALLFAAGCSAGAQEDSSRPDFTKVPQQSSSAQETMASADIPAAQADEYRGMWISYLEWPMFDTKNEETFTQSANTVLDHCVQLGLNTVIFQVRPFSDAVYPSEVYPWSHLVGTEQGRDPGYDPLAVMVREAHERGLRIEAWVNPYRVRLNEKVPPDIAQNSPAVQHPEWVRQANGGLYFDPALPQVQDLVVQGVKEIVSRYDVDGIQFDDYFYPSTDAEFDAESYALYGKGRSLDEWRRDNVNTLVKRVYETIKEEKPQVTFGISPQGNNDNNYYTQYSDVPLWLSQPGYVDYIAPQVYWGFDYQLQSGSDRFAFENITKEWLAMPRDEAVKLYFGLGAYRIGAGDGSAKESDEWQSGTNLAEMVKSLRNNGANGYALYRYENLFGGGEYAALMNEECAALQQVNAENNTEK